MITDQQVAFFRDNGYLRYGKVLEPDQVDTLRAGLDRVIALENSGADAEAAEFTYGHDRGGERVRKAITQYVNMWKREPAFEAVVRHPVLTEVARRLLDSDTLQLWHDQVISKPPDDNDDFHFHQDFYFWPLRPPQLVSCWLALDDATVDNGCMHVIPGSHVDPRFVPEGRGKPDNEAARQAMTQRSPSEGRPVELKAGECMFHHCLNWHGTPANRTDRQRRAFVIIYSGDQVVFHPEQSPNHVLVPYIDVEPGRPLPEANFPRL